jgi:hypothetical protein
MENPEEKYLKYLITNLETEYRTYHPGEINRTAAKLLKRLRNSPDLLKDIYIISKIKNLEILSAYLLFILKKSSEKQITFDNLLENIEEDRTFLKRELMNKFGESTYEETVEEEEYVEQDKTIDEWHSPESLEENVEKEFLDSDEFKEEPVQESVITEIKTKITDEVYTEEDEESMELIRQTPDKGEIYETPGSTEIKEIIQPDSGEAEKQAEEIYTAPEEKREEEPIMNDTPEIPQDYKETGKEKKKSTAEKLKGLFHFKKQKKGELETVQEEQEQETISIKSAEPKSYYDETQQVKKILIEHEAEDYSDYNKSLSEEKETPVEEETVIEEEYKENELFNEYEKILRERNLIIAEGLNRIKEIEDAEETEETDEEEKKIIAEIIENCAYMENYSREMTFEVITNIYSTIKLSLNNVKETGYRPDAELTDLFINAVILIQKLVSGDDYTGYENTVAKIESKLKDLKEEKEKKEREEKIRKEKEEVEKQLEEKYSDTKDRRKLLLLKNKILELENIIKSLDDIKGDFRTYEAHRTLSKTFPGFKEIVKYSVELEIENMAQLSESAYIFIKYVQNYRIDPFGKDVKEILNYIIVNFKLLYLGKTSKDIKVFISYLNNPDKIFTEKNNPL